MLTKAKQTLSSRPTSHRPNTLYACPFILDDGEMTPPLFVFSLAQDDPSVQKAKQIKQSFIEHSRTTDFQQWLAPFLTIMQPGNAEDVSASWQKKAAWTLTQLLVKSWSDARVTENNFFPFQTSTAATIRQIPREWTGSNLEIMSSSMLSYVFRHKDDQSLYLPVRSTRNVSQPTKLYSAVTCERGVTSFPRESIWNITDRDMGRMNG